MTLAVEGLACIGSFGGDLESLRRRTETFVRETASETGQRAALPKTETTGITRFFPAKSLRQMDHFTRMALLCACHALEDAGYIMEGEDKALPPELGIILVSGYGPAAPTFQFLDSIMEYGEQMASPLAFSHSVHNIPAASLAIKLGLSGPCLSITQLESPVTAGLLAASSWLSEGRVQHVLLGAVDEYTPLLGAVSARFIQEEKITRPFRRQFPLGEGAAFFLLCKERSPAQRGYITELTMGTASSPAAESATRTAPRVLASGFVPQHMLRQSELEYPAAAYGNIPVAQAFNAALAVKAQTGATGATPGIQCIDYSPCGLVGTFTLLPASIL